MRVYSLVNKNTVISQYLKDRQLKLQWAANVAVVGHRNEHRNFVGKSMGRAIWKIETLIGS
jgi:hypothetical protein